jgi:hypothetical protein
VPFGLCVCCRAPTKQIDIRHRLGRGEIGSLGRPAWRFNEAGEQLMKRLLELRAEGWTRDEIADRLNREGYHTACGQRFTPPIVTNLFRNADRKHQAPRQRILPPQHWRPTTLAKRLGSKSTTLNTWRRRGWIHARRIGRRWIYWADAPELERLGRLCAHPRQVMEKVPSDLTTPLSIPSWNGTNQPCLNSCASRRAL